MLVMTTNKEMYSFQALGDGAVESSVIVLSNFVERCLILQIQCTFFPYILTSNERNSPALSISHLQETQF